MARARRPELRHGAGDDAELLDRERSAREVDSPTYLGAASGPRPARALVDPARLAWGLRRACSRLGVAHLRGHAASTRPAPATAPGVRAARRRRGLVRAAPGRCWRPAPSRRCVRAIRRYVVPVYDYVLVTEPLSPAQRDALGWRGPPGRRRRRQPVPLLPPDRRRPHPLGRLRRHLPLRQRRSRPSSSSAPRRSRCSPRTSSPPSRSSRASASRTAGAARSTPAAASARSSAPRSAAASPTPSATPGSASAPAASARAWRSTCSTARDTERDRLRMVRRRPLPFPPEPLRWAVDRADPRARWRAPTATRAAADRGCACSTDSGRLRQLMRRLSEE